MDFFDHNVENLRKFKKKLIRAVLLENWKLSKNKSPKHKEYNLFKLNFILYTNFAKENVNFSDRSNIIWFFFIKTQNSHNLTLTDIKNRCVDLFYFLAISKAFYM